MNRVARARAIRREKPLLKNGLAAAGLRLREGDLEQPKCSRIFVTAIADVGVELVGSGR
jgi:hypothetical protein